MSRIGQVFVAGLLSGLVATGSVAADTREQPIKASSRQLGSTVVLTRWTVDAGGSASTGGAGLALHGSIGQPDAGKVVAGELVLRGGFWRTSVTQPDAVFQNGFE
jgi:hypothetical protein